MVTLAEFTANVRRLCTQADQALALYWDAPGPVTGNPEARTRVWRAYGGLFDYLTCNRIRWRNKEEIERLIDINTDIRFE